MACLDGYFASLGHELQCEVLGHGEEEVIRDQVWAERSCDGALDLELLNLIKSRECNQRYLLLVVRDHNLRTLVHQSATCDLGITSLRIEALRRVKLERFLLRTENMVVLALDHVAESLAEFVTATVLWVALASLVRRLLSWGLELLTIRHLGLHLLPRILSCSGTILL